MMFSFTTKVFAAVLAASSLAAAQFNLHCNSTKNALAYPLNPGTTQHDMLPFSFFLIDGEWCNYEVLKTCTEWTEDSPAVLSEWSYDTSVASNPACNGAMYWYNASNAEMYLSTAEGTVHSCAVDGSEMACLMY